jgi:phosphate transport system protein
VTRPTLDTQLYEIRMRIIRLGALVETALAQAMQGVQSDDQALCGLLIASDSAIDDVRSEVERLTFRSLTLQQPLAALDLRFLSSASSIAGDLFYHQHDQFQIIRISRRRRCLQRRTR